MGARFSTVGAESKARVKALDTAVKDGFVCIVTDFSLRTCCLDAIQR
jgi:hypothetical protein